MAEAQNIVDRLNPVDLQSRLEANPRAVPGLNNTKAIVKKGKPDAAAPKHAVRELMARAKVSPVVAMTKGIKKDSTK